MLEHTIRELGMRWELLDALFVEDTEGSSEFGFALRRSALETNLQIHARHFRAAWAALSARSAGLRETAHASAESLAAAEANLARVRSLPGYGVARKLRRALRPSRT